MSKQEKQLEQNKLSLLDMSKSQAMLTGGTLLAGSALDVLFYHSNPAGFVVAAMAAVVAARHGKGVLSHVGGVPSNMAEPLLNSLTNRLQQSGDVDVPRSKRTIMQRFMGIHPDPLPESDEDEQDEPNVKPKDERDSTVERARQNAQAEQQDAQSDDVFELPHAPKFKDMCHLLTAQRMILCYDVHGPVYGTVEDLLSMAVVGKPGRGKTTALMYYVAMLLKSGAEVFVWDPHGVMGELAVLNNRTLAGMPATAKVVYLDRKNDMVESVPVLQKKLAERDEEYRQCLRRGKKFNKHPLLLLADELPVIADYEEQTEKQYKELNKQLAKEDEEQVEVPSMIGVIRRFVLEARKWRCFFIGSGQSTDAEILPTRVTENLSSRIVFYSSSRRARMAGLEQEDVKKFLPSLRRADPGTMIFDCSRLDEPIIGAIPETTMEDFRHFLIDVELEDDEDNEDEDDRVPAAVVDASNVTLEQLLKLIKHLPDIDPNDARYQVAGDTVVLPFKQRDAIYPPQTEKMESLPPRKPGKYDKAQAAWHAGNKSVRKMMIALNVKFNEARTLVDEMHERGLINKYDKSDDESVG